MGIAQELGVEVDIVNYQKTPPDRATLEAILDKLEDPATDLVRRDSLWAKLGLTDEQAQSREDIIELLLAHKMLMQRPVIVTDTVAIIGRPKDRVRALLGG